MKIFHPGILAMVLNFITLSLSPAQEYGAAGDTVRLFTTSKNLVYNVRFSGNYLLEEIEKIRIISEYAGIVISYNGAGCVTYKELKEPVYPGQTISLGDPTCTSFALDIMLSVNAKAGHWMKAELLDQNFNVAAISDTLYFVCSPYITLKEVRKERHQEVGKDDVVGEWFIFSSKKRMIPLHQAHFKICGNFNITDYDPNSFKLYISSGKSDAHFSDFPFAVKEDIHFQTVNAPVQGIVKGDSIIFDGISSIILTAYMFQDPYDYKSIFAACNLRIEATRIRKDHGAHAFSLEASPESFGLPGYHFLF